ncbi:Pr6Pr family membrane protein [Sinisalibacter aestuarii]|uniref:Pr6Pr family membrane protein n=1 Tax=Sinisalibacter aestuarii TaxID=2949426 RepID=A0ABQ5LPP6_9RHOB|nr:Pr6Pr family membrane protein [Sinisalibacter aestuarii]GKY86969.1 hypothetical protein STA1M1_08380 [Sinisalibacter aestuarii]
MTRALATPARLAAGLVALTGLAALAAQCAVSHALTGGIGATLWLLAGYFTVLTNVLATLSFFVIAWRGASLGPSWLAGLALWIAIVGVVYHLLLARLWAPEGLAWWADQGLHSAMPLLTLLWWLAFAPKAGLGLRDALLWLIWPLGYTAYALIRGAITGQYPYPFLDVTTLGYGGVALNGAGLALAFFLAGLAVLGLARALTR